MIFLVCLGVFQAFLNDGVKTLETDRLLVVIHVSRVQTVITIFELDDVFRAHSYSIVIFDRDILQSLHEFSLHIACFGGFNSSVYETLSSTNGVEKELRCGQALVETVCHETLVGWSFGVVLEMWQGSIEEAIGHSLTANNLLSNA